MEKSDKNKDILIFNIMTNVLVFQLIQDKRLVPKYGINGVTIRCSTTFPDLCVVALVATFIPFS